MTITETRCIRRSGAAMETGDSVIGGMARQKMRTLLGAACMAVLAVQTPVQGRGETLPYSNYLESAGDAEPDPVLEQKFPCEMTPGMPRYVIEYFREYMRLRGIAETIEYPGSKEWSSRFKVPSSLNFTLEKEDPASFRCRLSEQSGCEGVNDSIWVKKAGSFNISAGPDEGHLLMGAEISAFNRRLSEGVPVSVVLKWFGKPTARTKKYLYYKSIVGPSEIDSITTEWLFVFENGRLSEVLKWISSPEC